MGILEKIASQLPNGKVIKLTDPLPKSRGQAIPAGYRNKLEAAFNCDLSGVRLHQDEEVMKSIEAQGLRVGGFTQGDDIYLPPGGLRIDDLAHECVHVLQQRGGTALKGDKIMVAR